MPSDEAIGATDRHDGLPQIRIGVLGPLALEVVGRQTSISSGRERAVLEALVLRGTAGMRTDAIVDAVWGSSPPPNARKAVQTYVARLRKALPPGLIASEADGYRLLIERRDAIDAHAFEDVVTAARGGSSSAALRDGLARWRGEPYASLADVPWVVGERVRLVELRRAAEEAVLDALLEEGQHQQAVAAAEAAVAGEPLRERRWAQLIVALFRSGRQADALRAYQRCRATLVEGLGIEPGEELRRLEQAVLAHDERLLAPTTTTRSTSALPALLEEARRRPMLGRDSELAILERQWAATAAGGRSVVVLLGEAGAGKTRLAAELAAVVLDAGRVLYGRCLPELAIPYQPFAEALGAPLTDISAAGDPGVADAALPADQHRVFQDVRNRLVAAARDDPVLAIVEDLHWATPPTLRLLRFLAESAELRGVLLLATTRTTADLDLGDLAVVSRLSLGPLGVDEVTELVSLRAPEELEAASTLHELAGGNPFLVEQLLLDRQAARRGGTAHASRAADVVTHRLHRLSDATRSVLELAALIDVNFSVDVVAAASTYDVDTVLTALEEAEATNLVVPMATGRFAFCHALVRAVLVEAMPAARRMRLHRDLAQAIERRPASARTIAVLARHFSACAPLGFADQAITYNRAAGDLARRSAAFEEAVTFYGAALDAMEHLDDVDEGTQCEIRVSQGDILRHIGDPRGQALLDEAMAWGRRHRDGRRFAAAVFAMNRFGLPTDVSGTDWMARLVEEALELLGDDERGIRARLLAVLAAELTFLPDADRRRKISSNAMELARALDDDEVLGRVLVGCIAAWAIPEDLTGRTALAEELLLVAQRLADDVLLCRAHREVALCALEGCDIERYRESLVVVRTLTASLRQPTFDWELAYMEAADLQLAGDLDGADAQSLGAVDLGRAAGVDERSLAIVRESLAAVVRFEQGRLEEYAPTMRFIGEMVPTSPFRYFLPMLQLELGDPDSARALLDSLAVRSFDDVPRRQTWPLTMTMVAEAAAEIGDEPLASSLYERLRPLRGRLVAGETFRYTSIDRILGRLSIAVDRLDDAEGHLTDAEAQAGRLGAPLLHARVVLDRARLALARGQRAEAVRLADAAIAEAHAFGALGIVASARRLLD